MPTLKKLIEIDKSLVTKLKIISAFENLSVKNLMEKAIGPSPCIQDRDRGL